MTVDTRNKGHMLVALYVIHKQRHRSKVLYYQRAAEF